MPRRRSDYDGDWPEYRPRLPADGIKAKSQRGEFGASWWGKRWRSSQQLVRNEASSDTCVDGENAVIVLQTARLVLRRLTPADAPFILELLNDPDWLRYIGDRGVRTVAQAVDYIESGPGQMYERHGFGLYLAALKESGTPIGLCGLIRRDFLEDVDIGFAFLPGYRGAGYAQEAAEAVLAYAASALGLKRVVAIVDPANHRSARLLEKLGLRFERMVSYPGEEIALRLFTTQLLKERSGL